MDKRILPCPRCGKKLRVPVDAVGKGVGCPYCQQVFRVPPEASEDQPSSRQASAPVSAPEGPAPRREDERGFQLKAEDRPSAEEFEPPRTREPSPVGKAPEIPPEERVHLCGAAIGSFALAIASICLFPLGALAAVFGFIALRRIGNDPSLEGRGLAIAGLCIGGLAFLVEGAVITRFFVKSLASGQGVPFSPLSKARSKSAALKCRNNLKQLGTAMLLYVDSFGGRKYCPFPKWRDMPPSGYNGSQWLAALYWAGTLTDPALFLCPATSDDNRAGKDLGTIGGSLTFSSATVSYAGKGLRSSLNQPLGSDFPANGVIASDDTEGRPNHVGGMNILFFDGRAEWNDRLDPMNAVGRTPPVDALEN